MPKEVQEIQTAQEEIVAQGDCPAYLEIVAEAFRIANSLSTESITNAEAAGAFRALADKTEAM